MEQFAEDLFDNIGTKSVTKTDKTKGAYVLNFEQREVMSSAGFQPGEGGDNATLVSLKILNDPNPLALTISYYNSIRLAPNRLPEARMGRDIVHWMDQGDVITIANIGSSVFAWKSADPNWSLNELGNNIASEADQTVLLAKARMIKGKPPRQTKTINDFRRNASIVAGAISRASGQCEMPMCTTSLFARDDGTNFLEVHHIIPLAEGGDDVMSNAAALCPLCHRELHFGVHRIKKREILKSAILSKELGG